MHRSSISSKDFIALLRLSAVTRSTIVTDSKGSIMKNYDGFICDVYLTKKQILAATAHNALMAMREVLHLLCNEGEMSCSTGCVCHCDRNRDERLNEETKYAVRKSCEQYAYMISEMCILPSICS